MVIGEINHYLGMEVERNKSGHFFINQKNYIGEIIEHTGLSNAKSSKIPLDTGYYKNNKDDDFLNDNNSYQKVIGQLLYVSVNSRPDISASVSILSRRIKQPRQTDWNEIKRVIRYLKETINLRLRISNSNTKERLVGFSDADWGESNDRKSNSGFLFKFNGGLISWSSRKQTCVALSSTESEFIALAEASQEGLWIKNLLDNFGEQRNGPILIYEDNQSCLCLVDKDKYSNRSKHIDIKYKFIKDLKTQSILDYKYCPSK